MRISDWSSDVCSSDLFDWTLDGCGSMPFETRGRGMAFVRDGDVNTLARPLRAAQMIPIALAQQLLVDLAGRGQRDRKSVVSGKSVSVRVDLGGRSIIKKKKLL